MGKLYEFKEQDAYDFANFVHIQAKTRGDELQFISCPYCHGGKSRDKGTFSINRKTGQFKCLRASCGITGNMITLARDFDFSLSKDVDEYYFHKTRYRHFKTPEKMPEPTDKVIEYLKKRGISKETAEKYKLTKYANREEVLVFPFLDEKGNMQFVKYRDTEWSKDKTVKGKDGKEYKTPKEWCEKGCKPILFGMAQCNLENKRLVITEGQMDSISVAESGIENATSVPNGAKGFTWIPHCWNWWCQFEELVVFGDFEKGHITLLDELSKRFPGTIKHVRKEDYKDCKDANEILLKYGKEQVRKCVENAECMPVKQVIQLADVKRRDLKDIPKMRTGFKYLDNMIGGYLYGGQLVILTGKRGQGKSTIANEICVSAIKQGKNVFAYSGELPSWQYKNWIDFAIAGPQNIVENELTSGEVQRFITNSNQDLINDWYRDRFYLYDNECIEDDELTDLLTTITNAIMQYGIDLVIIDNLMTALDVDLNKDEFRGQSKFIKKLQRLCKKLDVIIILVAHPKKNAISSDANDAVSGSGDITNAADIVMTFVRDKEQENHNFLKVSKNRWFGITHKEKEDGIDLWYDKKSRRLSGKCMDVNRKVGWESADPQQITIDGFVQITDDDDMPFK